jgi:hypothetical protein
MEELLCNIAIGQIPQGFPKETFFLLTNWELIIMAWQQTLTQGTVSAPTPHHISFYCFASRSMRIFITGQVGKVDFRWFHKSFWLIRGKCIVFLGHLYTPLTSHSWNLPCSTYFGLHSRSVYLTLNIITSGAPVAIKTAPIFFLCIDPLPNLSHR